MNTGLLATAAVPIALFVRVASSIVTLLAARRPNVCVPVAMVGSILASTITVLAAAEVLWSGLPTEGWLLHHTPSGFLLSYAVTPLSGWFLAVFGLVAIPVAVYSVPYLIHAVSPARVSAVGVGFNVMLGAVELVFVAADAVTFLLAWELMTLATAALVSTKHEDRPTRLAGYLYLVMSHLGTGCLIAGLLMLTGASGSVTFSAMFAGNVVVGPSRHVVFLLLLIGFGVKAGIIPFHVWLPEAHPAAPSNVSALMSAVLITTGIYGLVRMCVLGLGVPAAAWGLTLMTLGTLSAILGVLFALTQADLKRLLAYSTIENAGIIVLGVGAGMLALSSGKTAVATIAIVASLMHVLNHAMFKGLLFLSAGGVVMQTGTRQLEQFGGLLRTMGATGAFFLVGAMAISGLPLLNGFVSEWLTFQALLAGFRSTAGLVRLNYPLCAALLALTSALAAVCFVKVFGTAFLAFPRSRAAVEAHELPRAMLIPQGFLAVMCVALGLFPTVALGAMKHVLPASGGFSPSQDLVWGTFGMRSPVESLDAIVPAAFAWPVLLATVGAVVVGARTAFGSRRVPTWGCGGELSAQTAYTPSAFSKPLLMIFRAIYRPAREVEAIAEVSPYFTRELRYRTRLEPTFDRYVSRPLLRVVLRVAGGMRILQAGSLHAYLGYVLALAVSLLLWFGGRP